jgi:hypothetical protein
VNRDFVIDPGAGRALRKRALQPFGDCDDENKKVVADRFAAK